MKTEVQKLKISLNRVPRETVAWGTLSIDGAVVTRRVTSVTMLQGCYKEMLQGV